ncbi:Pvc16 family protein [Haliangium sp.]|uniref:Pvc16 family protein n=1 Tax=Haliangium sp. TaxID=2663208 RepID=UPI003D1122DE
MSRLLQDEFKRNGYKRVHIIEEAPKPDAVEGKLPAVSVYLYQVSLDPVGVDGNVHHEIVQVEKDDGSMEEFMRRRRLWLRLDYLISTWAQTSEDEQLLLGLVIRTIMENPSLDRERLRGDSFDDDFNLGLLLSTRLDEGTLARFWGSLSQPVRPAVQTWTTIPLIPEKMEPFTRVQSRKIAFRDLNEPRQEPESGPERPSLLSRRSLDLGRGKR